MCVGVAQLVQCNAADREALLDFKMGLNDSWNQLSSWQGTNCCQWSGISCDDTTGAVLSVDISLDIPNSSGLQPLVGEIRPSLAELKSLKHLDLSGNNFNGEIPSSIGSLCNIQIIDLSFNCLTRGLPNSLGHLKNLIHLYLQNNLLQGPIPAFIGNLQHLAHLGLSSNKLNGTLPDSLGLFSELCLLDVSFNELTGVISEAHFLRLSLCGDPPTLKCLDADSNNWGSRDDSDGGRKDEADDGNGFIDKWFYLSVGLGFAVGNRLSGPIPQGMTSLTFLGSLNLSNNNLSGRIPYKGQMTTFIASSFAGNSGLCGDPLALKCPDDGSNNRGSYNDSDGGRKDEADDGNGFIDKWFYLSTGLGFAVGLLLPYFIFATKDLGRGLFCFCGCDCRKIVKCNYRKKNSAPELKFSFLL
ncbi:hypothetical protein GH714_002506 [Hevea brasiliensis]|uniref:Uncharacterized protein n=1 Tax=Hevea brasiliensis TaxID=3981 RepID=A0A6A6KWY8_HEVBR|nr:hypothetical protein GH714_002506 [Hevea brasiliensis]